MTRIRQLAASLAVATGAAASLGAQVPPDRPGRVPAPTNVAISHGSVDLKITWTAMAGVSQYVVRQRQGPTILQLGVVSASPFGAPLPARGVAYEYQVVSVAGTSTAASPWIPYTVPTEPIVVDRRAGTRVGGGPAPKPGDVTPVGPATLSASSTVPAEIDLRWPPVSNAAGYKILRSSSVEPERVLVPNIPAISPAQVQGGYYWKDVDRVDDRYPYSYRVIALFSTPGTAAESFPSPTATARSAQPVAVTGLRYTTALSTNPTGTLNITLTWNAVPSASKYLVDGTGFTGTATMSTPIPTLVIPSAPPTRGTGYRFCVVAAYPYFTSPLTSCITVPI